MAIIQLIVFFLSVKIEIQYYEKQNRIDDVKQYKQKCLTDCECMYVYTLTYTHQNDYRSTIVIQQIVIEIGTTYRKGTGRKRTSSNLALR